MNKLPKVPISEPKLSSKNAVINGSSKTKLNMVLENSYSGYTRTRTSGLKVNSLSLYP